MANANAPRGIVPYKFTSGAPYNGACNMYYVPSTYATALYLGDPVIATGASDANGVPVVQIASAGATNYMLGAFVGIVDGGAPTVMIGVTQAMPIYHPASTSQYILVSDDPDLLYEVQEDSVGGSIAMATAGMKNADLVAGSGSTVTGISGWQLDSSTIGTGSTLQMRLIQGLRETDNQMAATNAKWLVKVNLHSLNNLTGV